MLGILSQFVFKFDTYSSYSNQKLLHLLEVLEVVADLAYGFPSTDGVSEVVDLLEALVHWLRVLVIAVLVVGFPEFADLLDHWLGSLVDLGHDLGSALGDVADAVNGLLEPFLDIPELLQFHVCHLVEIGQRDPTHC